MHAPALRNITLQLAKELKIRRVNSAADISTVAALHMRSFSNLLSGQLGLRFLQFYFTHIMHLPAGVIYVCTDKDAIVGFVAGVSSKKKLYSVRLTLIAFLSFVWQFCLHPFIFLGILRHLKRTVMLQKKTLDAELLSIVVEKPYRKQGIGKVLVDQFEKFLRSQDIEAYEVFTDMRHSLGYLLYEHLGFKLRQEVDLFGLKARVYTKIL